MRASLFSLLLICCCLARPARAEVQLLGVQVMPERAATHFVIALSGSTPSRVAVKSNPDRVEVDFPGAAWSKTLPESGPGGGFVDVYRHATAPDGGTRLVLETTTGVKIASAGAGLALPHQPVKFDLEIVSDDGSLPPALAAVPPAKPAVAKAAPKPAPEAAVVAVMTSKTVAPAEMKALPVALTNTVPATQKLEQALKQEHAGHPRLIAIDPGHGGVDPGTEGVDGSFEKDITLATGLALKHALEATGRYKVVMTRADDTFIPLQERVAIARTAGAELFISLHCDAKEGEGHGATVYTLSQTASDAVSARLAASENSADAVGGIKLAAEGDVANILISLSTRDSLNQSNRFASLVVGELDQHNIRLQEIGPHRAAGFAVLKAPDMPSVLIEMGYLSDETDNKLLENPKHQAAFSTAVLAGIDRYFRVGEGGRRS